jgi:hypothetical protein
VKARTKVNPRSVGVEEVFLEDAKSPEKLAVLRDRVLDLGEPSQTANGVVGFLLNKATGRPDDTSSATRAKYRKILTRLLLLTPIIFDPEVMSNETEDRPVPALAGAAA